MNNTRKFLLEWMSFLHRYVPVGLLERVPQRMNERAPAIIGRDDLETLMASTDAGDWVRITYVTGERNCEGRGRQGTRGTRDGRAGKGRGERGGGRRNRPSLGGAGRVGKERGRGQGVGALETEQAGEGASAREGIRK